MRNRIFVAAVTLSVLGAEIWFGELPRSTFPILERAGRAIGPYGYAAILNTVQIAAPVLALTLILRSLPGALRELGLAANPLRPLLFGLVATAPAWIGFLLTSHESPAFTLREFVLLCWAFPLAEEVMFRGFAFGLLYRRAGWPFWPAALLPAFVFGACHLYQSTDPMELAGIFAITAFGSVVFSYFFVRFRGNIWAPFALHAFLNTWWMVFTPNASALGGVSDNLFRFGSIALAFAIVFAAARLPVFRVLAPATGGVSRPGRGSIQR